MPLRPPLFSSTNLKSQKGLKNIKTESMKSMANVNESEEGFSLENNKSQKLITLM